MAGYGLAGAAAALAMDRLAWLTQQSAALRPAWTLLHVGMLAWGLLMALQARQPLWVERAGRAVWDRVGPAVRAPGGLAVAGLAWALMPCGLLYSALLVAALAGSPAQGAATMAAFGGGSALWLLGGTWAWRRLRSRGGRGARHLGNAVRRGAAGGRGCLGPLDGHGAPCPGGLVSLKRYISHGTGNSCSRTGDNEFRMRGVTRLFYFVTSP